MSTVKEGPLVEARRVEKPWGYEIWWGRTGDTIHIPPGTVHRMTGIEDCEIVEVSTPELDDVVRLEDRYGRAGTSEP